MDITNSEIERISEQLYHGNDPSELRLIKRAVSTLLGNVADDEGCPWHPYRCIKPAKNGFNGIWNWDSAFHAMGVSMWDAALAREQILGFIQYQTENGMYPDVVWGKGGMNICSSKPPVMCTAAEIVYKADKNKGFLTKVYPSLVRNEGFWTAHRRYNGLFYYDADSRVTPYDKNDINIQWESGWDNSVRWNLPIRDLWAIDLNCFMLMTYRSLAYIAEELELSHDALKWKNKAAYLEAEIENVFWNDEIKAYTDVNRFTGEKSDVLTPASFMPLYVGIAGKERAELMARLGGDKTKFYPAMPTVSYDNPCYSNDYWRGPVWLNVAYFAAKGIKNYGYDDIADGIKNTILKFVENDPEAIRENYNSATGEGLYAKHFSWSSVFVLEFILNF